MASEQCLFVSWEMLMKAITVTAVMISLVCLLQPLYLKVNVAYPANYSKYNKRTTKLQLQTFYLFNLNLRFHFNVSGLQEITVKCFCI